MSGSAGGGEETISRKADTAPRRRPNQLIPAAVSGSKIVPLAGAGSEASGTKLPGDSPMSSVIPTEVAAIRYLRFGSLWPSMLQNQRSPIGNRVARSHVNGRSWPVQ